MSTGSAFARVIGLTKSLSPFERKSDASGEPAETIVATPPADPAGSQSAATGEGNPPEDSAPAGGVQPAPDADLSERAAASTPGPQKPAGAERPLTAADSPPGDGALPGGPAADDAGTHPGPDRPTTDAALPWTPESGSPEGVQPTAAASNPAAESLGGPADILPFGPVLAVDPTADPAAAGASAGPIDAPRAPEAMPGDPADAVDPAGAVDKALAETSAAEAPALAQVTLVAADPSAETAPSDATASAPVAAAPEPNPPVTGPARGSAGLRRTVTAEAINAIEADIASLLASLDASPRPAEPIVDDGDEGLAGAPDDDVDAATLVLLSELDRLWRADPMVAAQHR